MSARPSRLIVVVGTGTEVGKTWASARLLETWRAQGRSVAARKPAQSFEPGDDTAAITDAQVLAAATGEDPTAVCPPHRWYPMPMAPPMAADVLGEPAFRVADLIAELRWPDEPVDIGLVETAGGVRSPIADDGDASALIQQLQPDAVLLVADAGLGTINAVLLSMAAILEAAAAAAPPLPTAVFLNRFDDGPLHRRNRDWLTERTGLACATDVASLAALLDGLPSSSSASSG